MRYLAWCAGLIGLALLGIMPMSSAQAQATRTWVSGVGDDANPCSRTAPCKTFAGAISKTAAGGEINCIDPGGFGAVTITKAMAIKCDNVEAGILVAGTNGVTVNAGVNDVVFLSGLDFEGLGSGLNGINFLNGKALYVKNCIIRGFTTNGINFAPGNASAALVVVDTTVADNAYGATAGGIVVKPGGAFNATASITNTQVTRNLFGVAAQDRSKVTVFRSTIDANANNGVAAVANAGGVVEINVVDSVISNTGINGVRASGATATVRLVNSHIIDNNTGIAIVSSGTVAGTTPGTNMNVGNPTPGAFNASTTLQ